MKSFSDLNKKWWYRLLKVLYCGFFLLVAIVSAIAVFSLNDTYLSHDLKITCDYGNKSTFNAFHDKGISIADYDPYKEIPASINQQILSVCGVTPTDIAEASIKAHQQALIEYNQLGCGEGNRAGLLGEEFCPSLNAPYQTFNMYQMPDTYIPVHTYGKAAGYTVLDLLIVFAVFEIVRRAFYYVATGKIRPAK